MKILFLANRVPYPPFRGDKLKIYNLAKRLAEKHELHLLTFAQNDEDWQYESVLQEVFSTVQFINLPKQQSVLNTAIGLFGNTPFQVSYFKSNAMKKAVSLLLSQHQFDAVHVQHLRMAQYLENESRLPRILDLPDAFSLYWWRKMTTSKNPIFRFFETIEQKRVYRYEQILKRYPLSLVCSVEDKEYLEKEHNLSNVQLLPNGVDTKTFSASKHDYQHSQTILFTGNMDYGPNIDAVQYFAQDILPIIRAKRPDVCFVIAGQRPVPKVQSLACSYIRVTGFVPNLANQYNEASVVVAPLRFGAGTQNKVLEAMAMGVPVVCSNIGFKGLGIESGEGAIMQTDPNLFANAVLQLLDSQQLRKSVGEKGIHLIRTKFSWDIIALQLEQYFLQVTKAPN